MSITLFLVCLGTYVVLDRVVSNAEALAAALLVFLLIHMLGGH